jgi:hypothetical protein
MPATLGISARTSAIPSLTRFTLTISQSNAMLLTPTPKSSPHLVTQSSSGCTPCTSCLPQQGRGSEVVDGAKVLGGDDGRKGVTKCVTTGTMVDAPMPGHASVIDSTCAQSVEGITGQARIDAARAKEIRPKYQRGYLWDDKEPSEDNSETRSALVSFTAAPWPLVPDSIANHPAVQSTLCTHQHLFRIVSPIDVDKFEKLLNDHPNPNFVSSVCRGLRNGAWPFAQRPPDCPITYNYYEHN